MANRPKNKNSNSSTRSQQHAEVSASRISRPKSDSDLQLTQQDASLKPEYVPVQRKEPESMQDIGADVLPGRGEVAARIRRETRVSTFNGPMPHPEIFRAYGEVVKDAPERILRVFEEDSKHSRDIQMAALNAQRADNRRIQWMAFSLIAGGYAASIFFALIEKPYLAGIVLTTTIVGTVVGFLQGKKSKPEENEPEDTEE